MKPSEPVSKQQLASIIRLEHLSSLMKRHAIELLPDVKWAGLVLVKEPDDMITLYVGKGWYYFMV